MLEEAERYSQIVSIQMDVARAPHEAVRTILHGAVHLCSASAALLEQIDGPDSVVRFALGAPVGGRARLAGSLAGLCRYTRKIVLCEDVETDERVHREIYWALNVRSIAMVPLRDREGVLQVWSPRPGAFNDRDVQTLQVLCGLLEGVPQRSTAPPPRADARMPQELFDLLRERGALLELADEAMTVRGLDQKVVFWNRAAEELYGWPRASAQGQPLHRLLHTRSAQTAQEIERLLLLEGRWSGELLCRRQNGDAVTVRSRWVLHRDARGRPRGVLQLDALIGKAPQTATSVAEVPTTPVYEEPQPEPLVVEVLSVEQPTPAAEEPADEPLVVEVLAVELPAPETPVVEILAVEVHEQKLAVEAPAWPEVPPSTPAPAYLLSLLENLRAPLRFVDGSLQQIVGGSLGLVSDKARRALQAASADTERVLGLVDDAQELERYRGDEPRLQRRAVSIHDIMSAAANAVLAQAERAAVNISLTPRADEVWVDLTAAVIATSYLLSSAVSMSPRGGRVWLKAEKHADEMLLQINDKGGGIAPEALTVVFEPFRGPARNVRLAISHAIIRAHGGRIWVDSTVGVGSEFTFTFPLYREDAG